MRLVVGLGALCLLAALSQAAACPAKGQIPPSCQKGYHVSTDIDGTSGCCPRGFTWGGCGCSRYSSDIIPPGDVKLQPTPVAPDSQLEENLRRPRPSRQHM